MFSLSSCRKICQEKLSSRISKLDCLKQELISCYADAENARKSRIRSVDSVINESSSRFLTDFGSFASKMIEINPVINDLNCGSLVEGFSLTTNGLISVLAKNGLRSFSPQLETHFDEKTMVSADSAGLVVKVVKPGWMLETRPVVKAVVNLK
jgi:molecular chaperone GrpE (heat shock protein)